MLDENESVCYRCNASTGTARFYKQKQDLTGLDVPVLSSDKLLCLTRVERSIMVKHVNANAGQWKAVSGELYVRGGVLAGVGAVGLAAAAVL